MDDPLKRDVEVHCAGSAAKSNCIRARFVIIRHFVTPRNATMASHGRDPNLNRLRPEVAFMIASLARNKSAMRSSMAKVRKIMNAETGKRRIGLRTSLVCRGG